MAKKSVFSNPSAKESHSRNGFDRSFVNNVNFCNGQLIPTFCQFVFGKSHARINQRSFFRTADVNTAAFPSLPLYTDFFYVPMTQIVSCWNEFRSRTNDRSSSIMGVPSRLPSFSSSTFRYFIQDQKTNNYIDDAGARAWLGNLRLADLLDYGYTEYDANRTLINPTTPITDALPETGDQTPLKACAYQKVYYDHYRNTAYERNYVQAYNLDDLFTTSGDVATPNAIPYTRLQGIFELHYVNYHRDMFTTIYPSLNFIASAANGLQANNTLPSSVLNYNYYGTTPYNAGVPQFGSDAVNINDSVVISGLTVGRPFSTQNLRVSFALEKLLRVSAFTPQHVKDQFMARFGYTPKSSLGRESVRLGSFKNDIIVGEVTSTAMIDPNSYNQRLGTIGGKGVGAADYGKTISYDVPEDGIIIGVSYVLPQLTYDANKVDPINQQFVPEDWSLPEYENLGLQPIYAKNISIGLVDAAAETYSSQLSRANRIVGYQPRDMQYKASVSTNHGEFMATCMLSPFVLHGNYDWMDWMRRASGTGLSSAYFKCKPQDLNDIFVTATDGDIQSQDQFFGSIVNQFAVIQDKPIFGIPNI